MPSVLTGILRNIACYSPMANLLYHRIHIPSSEKRLTTLQRNAIIFLLIQVLTGEEKDTMRRHLIRSLTASLTALSLLLPSIRPADFRTAFADTAPLTIYIAADPHYIAPSLTDNGSYFRAVTEAADGKFMLRCEELTSAFISQVIYEQPDVLILPGDLSFNGAKASHLALAEKLQTVKNSGVSVLVIPGNHDLNDPMAAAFHGDGFVHVDSVTPEEFAEIYADFGYHAAIARDPASLSYVAALGPDLRILMLDVNTPSSPGILTDETLRWVELQLQRAMQDGFRVVAVSHQTLLEHAFLSYGIVMGNAEKLLALYEEYGVICNLSGHMHIQHISHSSSGLSDIAGSALITWPNQFGVLRLDGSVAEYTTKRVDVSALPGFEPEALSFLRETGRRQVAAELHNLQIAAMDGSLRDYLVQANLAYVAGRPDTLRWDSPLYERWQSVPSLYAYYLRTIRDDGLDHTRLRFPLFRPS